MNNTHISGFEEKVRLASHTPDPHPEFVETLWEQIMTRPQHQPTWKQRIRYIFFRPVWAVTAIFVLVLMIALALAGPQRVLAALQDLFGYIPGVGFVSTANAVAMREPVDLIQNGRVFRVEQLLSSNKETILVIRIQGFPAYQNVGLDNGISLEMTDGYSILPRSVAVDVTVIPGEYFGVFKFAPLPVETRQLTVTWEPASGIQSAEPVKWRVPVTLYPIADPNIANLLPNSYEPENAYASLLGITLKIDKVSNNPSTTALRLQMIFPQVFDFASPTSAVLMDEMGRVYQNQKGQVQFEDNGQPYRIFTTPGPTPQVYKNLYETLDFPGINPEAKQLTLLVDQLNFRASPKAIYSIDLGTHPSIGDTWSINQILTIGELSIRINRARLVALEQVETGTKGQSMLGLVLDIEPINPGQVQLSQVWVQVSGSQEVYDQSTFTWTAAWLPDQVPGGTVDIHLDMVQGTLNGDWKIEWKPQKP